MARMQNNMPKRTRKYTAIRLRILFHMAWRNIVSKKLRSLLTVFGVVIGIAAIFFLLSFGLGLQLLVTEQVIGDQSVKSIDVSSANSKLIKLNEEAVNKFKVLSHVEKVGTQHSFPGSLRSNGGEIDAVVYGIDSAYQDMSSLNASAGDLLKDSDIKTALINTPVLEAIGIKNKDQAIGKTIDLVIPLKNSPDAKKTEIEDTFKIVGVIDSGSGTEVFIPNANFSVVGIEDFQDVKIIVDDSSNVNGVRKQVESIGYQTTSPVDTLDQINQIFKFFTLILIGFGSIGMIVSILGMFNTLTISLLERTKEIGLMMALGGRNSDMRKLFIFEAVLISLGGAIVGIIFAVIGGKIVTLLMNQYAASRGVNETFTLFSTPSWAILALISFTLIVGMIVVWLPAGRAQKINPIDALRRE